MLGGISVDDQILLLLKNDQMKFLSSLFILLIFGCNSKQQKQVNNQIDSSIIKELNDTDFFKKSNKKLLRDTTASVKGPVQLISTNLKPKANPQFKELTLTYKNKSSKNIILVRFVYIGLQEVELNDGRTKIFDCSGGFDIESPVRVGQTVTNTRASSLKIKELKKVYVSLVDFEDGTQWSVSED